MSKLINNPKFNKQLANHNQTKLKIDINQLEDICCIECSNKEFQNITRIKFLPSTVSPNGQEGFANVLLHKCDNCGWTFDPNQYKIWRNDKLKEKQDNSNQFNEVKKPISVVECDKCGETYRIDAPIKHICK